MTVRWLVVGLMCGTTCQAQRWEIGFAGGYGFYRSASIYAPAGKATAGVQNRFVIGATLGDNMYEHVSGEVRYTYQDGDPVLKGGGAKANLQGQSHAFHYDLLFHARPRRARVRPYIAVGVGVKQYVGTGPENAFQPLSQFGLLTDVNEVKPLLSAGGGVKMRWGEHVVWRVDFRAYGTPFPKKIIAPAPGGTARGLFQQFTPMVGVSYVF